MKNLIRYFLILIILGCLAQRALVSQQTTIGAQLELAQPYFKTNKMAIEVLPGLDIPLNFIDFGDANEMGYGASAYINHKINPRAEIGLKAGYIKWDVAEIAVIKAKVTAIPLQMTAKYFLYEGLYAAVDAGETLVNSKITATFLINISKSDPQTLFSVAPGLGYRFNLGSSVMDIQAKYNFTGKDYNYLGLTAGIGIPFK